MTNFQHPVLNFRPNLFDAAYTTSLAVFSIIPFHVVVRPNIVFSCRLFIPAADKLTNVQHSVVMAQSLLDEMLRCFSTICFPLHCLSLFRNWQRTPLAAFWSHVRGGTAIMYMRILESNVVTRTLLYASKIRLSPSLIKTVYGLYRGV
jgi:hypothetical protein